LVWGFDVGRDRDASEITVLEVKDGRHYQRLMITMRQIPFELQKKVLGYLLSTLPIYRGYVDKGGPGRDLAEFCEESYGEDRCTGIWFDNQKKELWALNLKKTMERSNIVLIPDRDQESQLHSIQRRVTTAKHMIYEITDNKSNVGGGKVVRHHADKFWSLALANWAGIGMVLSYSPSGATVPPPPGMPTAKQMSENQKRKISESLKLRFINI
jgi:phage FluMu gp28-like protein